MNPTLVPTRDWATVSVTVGTDVDEANADALRELTENSGALVPGRRLFDIANGWTDTHSSGASVVVATHSSPPSRPHTSSYRSSRR